MDHQPEVNSFVRLNSINVSSHLEKKGKFSYLSWPFAVAELRKTDPLASWEVKRFNGLPYLATETGYFVEVAVTVQGVTLSQVHPVLDSSNRTMFEPNAFDINTSIQRCLVKAISLHGLGLYVFAGEDLPEPGALTPPQPKQPPETAQPRLAAKKPTPLRQVEPLIDATQQTRITALIAETGAELNRLLEYFGVDSLSQIQAKQYDRVIRSLQNRRAA